MPGPVNMEDPQEYKSLDELFRKTFEELPESPAPSGWDAPSPRVWEQVQTQIRPPKSGWTTQFFLLVAGMAVVLLLGLYWALTRPDQPDTDTKPVATEQPALVTDFNTEAVPVAASPAAEQPVAAPARPAAPANAGSRQPARPAQLPANPQPENRTHEDEPGIQHRPAGSMPLPGSAHAPNTTIRRQMEELRNAPWAQPLAPLPSILKILQEKSTPSLPKGG